MIIKKNLNIFFVLSMIFVSNFFIMAEVEPILSKEVQEIKEQKLLTTSTENLQPLNIVPEKKYDTYSNKENLMILKRKCLSSNFRLLLKENREQLREIQLSYKKLFYSTVLKEEKEKLSNEYRMKLKNLNQEFLTKLKKTKENCENLVIE
ncbi:MAG: hypothetical protein KatS3mg095_0657 [Candidatus Parcubacteria bacterium]|nr:MAG: hypothetical protein KatS3mg095_0657 [Candidatus Parcubacteria bacterium]